MIIRQENDRGKKNPNLERTLHFVSHANEDQSIVAVPIIIVVFVVVIVVFSIVVIVVFIIVVVIIILVRS